MPGGRNRFGRHCPVGGRWRGFLCASTKMHFDSPALLITAPSLLAVCVLCYCVGEYFADQAQRTDCPHCHRRIPKGRSRCPLCWLAIDPPVTDETDETGTAPIEAEVATPADAGGTTATWPPSVRS